MLKLEKSEKETQFCLRETNSRGLNIRRPARHSHCSYACFWKKSAISSFPLLK